jgi:membrane dipeptidase
MTDDMIKALAKNGGVIGINFGEGFLNPKDAEILKRSIGSMNSREPQLTGKALDKYASDAIRKEFIPGKSNAVLDDAVKHIDHVVKIAGIDHVGIGSDFDGITAPPRGLEDASKLKDLKAALKKKGYSDADIAKIWGGNFLRVFREVSK